jgi:hypothetical protein
MHDYRYSPLDILEYRVTALSTCEVNEISKCRGQHLTALWNLFWLSTPTIDALPIHGKTAKWFKHYLPTPGACRAITADAIADEALYRKLQLHPTRFLAFFEREDHSIYDCYNALGGDVWVQNVITRAESAALRMAYEVPELRRSNVYGFTRKRPPDDTASDGPNVLQVP